MPKIVYLPRSFWTDDPPGGHPLPHNKINQLVAHHTVFILKDYDGDGFLNGDLDDIKSYMLALRDARPDLAFNGVNEVPYSFVHFFGAHDDEAFVVEGRGWDRTGAHTLDYNSKVYGCATAGNTDIQPATPGLIASYRLIGSLLPNPMNAGRTMGHRDIGHTACPGQSLYDNMGLLQPPFLPIMHEEDDEVVKPEFVMRNNGDPRVYLAMNRQFKSRQFGPDRPNDFPQYSRTAALLGQPDDFSTVVRLDPEVINGMKDFTDDPAW
jgi:hypothetical protein